ncbi:MAG: iron ABC transporter permease [Calditrichaeota bacterium]|nr:iron ABC transporter permease [Calditrichota bacterium]
MALFYLSRQSLHAFWRKHGATLLPLIPVVAILLAYVLYPNLHLLVQSFLVNGKLSLQNYFAFFDLENSVNLEALWGSVYISLLTVAFSALVGVPLAYLFTHYDFPGKSLFASVAVLPLVLPPLVGVLAFLFLFGESGMLPRTLQALFGLESVPFALDGVAAILVVHVYSLYVYFYLFASSFFMDLDASILEAAQNLGASRWLTLRKVVLPMMTPALGGASLLVFMTSMASFSAPFIFAGGFRILSLEIYNTKLNGELELAVTQSVVLAGISVLFLILLRKYSERRQYVGGGKGVRVQPRVVKSGWARLLMAGLGVFMVMLLILPHLTVILISFVKNGTWTWQVLPTVYTLENYTDLFRNPDVAAPVVNSLKMATLATVANVLFGVAAAYLLIRRKFAGKKLVEVCTMLPWAIPGTVLAISLIVTFNKPTIITAGHILVGSFWILPLAYFIRNLPLVFRSTYASLEQFEPALEESARNLGADWWFAFRKVMLPLIAPGVISGALLAFVLALGEFVSSILLYNYFNRPISVEIISQLRIFNLGSAAAYSVFLIILIGLVVLVSNRFLGRRKVPVVF